MSEYTEQQPHRPPAGEVRVVKVIAEGPRNDPDAIDLKPGQSICVVEYLQAGCDSDKMTEPRSAGNTDAAPNPRAE